MNVQVLDEAVADLADGFRFYELQDKGLGDYFLDSLWSDIQSLRIYAGVHAMHCGHYRLISKRFPFAVYYKFCDETVHVYAVLDTRQNPEWIIKRLNKIFNELNS